MQNSYLLAGIKVGRLMTMICRNKGISLKYIFRFLFLLNAGLWSAIFSRVERKKYKSTLNKNLEVKPPIFIVGNWRTGTTLLHQLFAVDKQFATPTVFQVANPDHFLVSKKYYAPVMTKALGNKRPMDNVIIGVFEPQEDEYALLKICEKTPLEKLIFQQSDQFFLNDYNIFKPENELSFIEALNTFLKKLTLDSNKQILFKNPFHSLRLKLLIKHYPKAKFVHIYRNPYKVIPSSIHMWNIVGSQNILKGKWIEPSVESIAFLYKRIINSIREQFGQMDDNQCIEIKFEDLTSNPQKYMKKIYEQLELNFTKEYAQALNKFCGEIKSYKKNVYNINEDKKRQIQEILADTTPEYFQSGAE